MKAIILAGGLGTRLKPFTEIIPKPLLPIGEKAILEIQIDHLVKCGFQEVFLATNFKSEYIENFFGDGSKHGVKLHISKEEKPLGTAGPLSLLKKHLNEPFLVMNGDVLCSMNYLKFYEYAEKRDALLTIGIKKLITPFEFGNIISEGEDVTRIEEKPDLVHHILAGIYIMKPEIFEFIPNNEYFGMDNLIHALIEQGEKVKKYEINDYWLDVGRPGDYELAQKKFSTNS